MRKKNVRHIHTNTRNVTQIYPSSVGQFLCTWWIICCFRIHACDSNLHRSVPCLCLKVEIIYCLDVNNNKKQTNTELKMSCVNKTNLFIDSHLEPYTVNHRFRAQNNAMIIIINIPSCRAI